VSARQQLVLRVHHLDVADGVLADLVFHDDDVARLADCRVRLGGDNHAERLEVGGDAETGVVAGVGHQLAEVLGVAFGCDGPEDIREILGTEAGRGLEAVELGRDLDAASFGFDGGLALGVWEQDGALEIDAGRQPPVLVVDRLDCAFDHSHLVDGHGPRGLGHGWRRGLRLGRECAE
jgi:hypothetical protein